MSTEISSNPTEIVQIPNTNDTCSSSFNNSAEITTTQNRNVDDNDNAAKWVCGSETRCSIRTLLNLFKGEGKREKSIEQKAAATTSNSDVVDSIRKYITNLKEATEALEVQFPDPTKQQSDSGKPSKFSVDGSKEKLRDLEKTVGELKLQISNYITNSAKKDLRSDVNATDLYKSRAFEDSSLFKCFEVLYDDLEIELKLCLLCFSAFPENATIKRSLMIYWWIGEGFVRSTQDEKTAEEMGIEFFEKLMAKGFIEPFAKKKRLHVKECRMPPVVRLVVIKLAERANFFDFGQGNPTPTARFSSSCRACLTGEDEEFPKDQDLDVLHSLFNFNLPYLDLKSKWFSKMKNVNLIFLGRWQNLDTDYTEVQDNKFLDGLQKNRYLRVLSLRGIFGIKNLPDSISGLVNLIVLDLRACYNLELVPKKIGLLKCLTHLDMSDCYLLEHMPKELSKLSQLQVLKGFVVRTKDTTNSCTLEDLKNLGKLRKLSIFIESKSVPTETETKSVAETETKSGAETETETKSGPETKSVIETETKLEAETKSVAETETGTKSVAETETGTKSVAETETGTKSVAETETGTKSKSGPETKSVEETETKLEAETETKSGVETKSVAETETKSGAETKSVAETETKSGAETKPMAETETRSGAAMKSVAETTSVSKDYDFSEFKMLAKLTIEWEWNSPQVEVKPQNQNYCMKLKSQVKSLASNMSHDTIKENSAAIQVKRSTPPTPQLIPARFPPQLEKLDLRGFPGTIAHKWLKRGDLENLKRLYFRGGKLGHFQDPDRQQGVGVWGVEVLRLKHLRQLKMNWRELRELFPELIYLENVKCPKLTFFPCDATGVWMKR